MCAKLIGMELSVHLLEAMVSIYCQYGWQADDGEKPGSCLQWQPPNKDNLADLKNSWSI